MNNVGMVRFLFMTCCFLLGCAILLNLCGCSSPGETRTEVNERHMRVIKTQNRQIQDDMDAVLLLDRPSKLSDKITR